jgi:xylulose-5-phosphate/fructose-6-phosphate phosphoketolase
VPKLAGVRQRLHQEMDARLLKHHAYIRVHGQDMPEILEWQWRQG